MNETSTEQSESRPALAWILALVIFCVYFFVSTQSTIWDRDEARFCRATDEMIWSGNYLYPTFLGELRPDKPILIYWLMSIPVRLFGRVEWAYRLWAVLGTVLSCVLTYKIGRLFFGRSAGLWAMAILAANGLVAFVGAVGTTDAVLLAEMTGMFLVFARALKRGKMSAGETVALALLVAAGMLTKGPVALLPLLSFLATRLILRKEMPGAGGDLAKIGVAAAIGLALFAAWFIPANKATDGKFYDLAFRHHVIDRVTTPQEHHGGHSPFDFAYYFIVIFVAFFPWTFFLPAALVRTSRKVYGGRIGKVFLFSWFLTVLLTMIAVSTKLPHYILPAFPALALMCACAIREYAAIPFFEYDVEKSPKAPAARWLGFGGFLFLLTTLALASGLGYGLVYFAKDNPEWGAFASRAHNVCSVVGALIALAYLPVAFRWRARHVAWNGRILFAGFMAFLVGASWLMIPEFESLKLSDKAAAMTAKHSTPNAPVLMTSFSEASLIFYLEKHPIADLDAERAEARAALKKNPPNQPLSRAETVAKVNADALAIWAGKISPGMLIIPKSEYDQARTLTQMPVLNAIGELNGVNYSKKGKWIELLVLKRAE